MRLRTPGNTIRPDQPFDLQGRSAHHHQDGGERSHHGGGSEPDQFRVPQDDPRATHYQASAKQSPAPGGECGP